MERPQLPLGDYYQLLDKHGLLAASPLSIDLTARISAVTCDSRSAVPGSLFICKGAAFREEYLAQALSQGALAYVSEKRYGLPAPCIRVTDIRAAMGLMADLAWGHPSGELKVIGLTGTKGKTTTAYFLKTMLDAWRAEQKLHPVGLLSTLVTDDGTARKPAVLTTPEPLDLQRHLFNAVNAGCGYLVMECSSQALKYGRMTGVDLAAAAFLNLGEDHISPKEHPTAEDYFQSKLKIFDHAADAVVNLDSERAGEILAAAKAKGCSRIVTYSMKDPAAQVYGYGLKHTGRGVAFTLRTPAGEEEMGISFGGDFNVSNALCAVAAAGLVGVPLEFVRRGLERAAVPGRMETYEKDGKTVIVDYAHNGMALEALLRSVAESHPGVPITAVFGCVGDKALDRREGMGKAAGKFAHRVILTEDDPGGEAVEDICAEIGRSIAPFGKKFTIIPDRTQAVKTAIETAPSPAVIVLAGKGAEQAQKRKNGPEPCVPDGMLAKKYLRLSLTDGSKTPSFSCDQT